MGIFGKKLETVDSIAKTTGAALSHIVSAVSGIDDPETRRVAITAAFDYAKQEASHKSLFIAGWRPFIGWVCGFVFAIVGIEFAIMMVVEFFRNGMKLEISLEDIVTLAVYLTSSGLFGHLRSKEKEKGVNNRH